MDRDPDQALLSRHRNGDRAAFPMLVARYQRPLYNAAYRVLGNAEDAADVTQDVFLRISQRLDDYDDRHKFFSWIYRMALNAAMNVARHNGHAEPLDDDDAVVDPHADPEWRAGEAELSARVQAALMKLRVADRAVLVLRHFSECSYLEIAAILEIEEKTVKSRLHEARLRMRELLAELHPA